MANNGKWICLVVIFLLTFSIGTALASDGVAKEQTRSDRTTDISHRFITGNEDGVAPSSYATGPSRLNTRSGIVASPGITWYDYQHNGSMGRQVVYDGVGNYVHFLWMYKGEADGTNPNGRGAAYNAWAMTGGMQWSELTGGGKLVSSGQRAGYVSLDVTDWGAAVASFHEAVALRNNTRADFDTWIPLGYFDSLGSPGPDPPSCEGWVTGGCETGSDFIWPIVDWDKVGDDSITHVASIEAPDCGDAGEIQTIAYYRKVNNAWPHCATAIDSVYNICQVVRSDPNSDKVAIVYLKPMFYDGDPMDVCGFGQWQNDVVYYESTNGGVSFIDHTAAFTNVTDYSQGHTLGSDEMIHMAYTDVSAVYDSDGHLHIVWNTPVRDMSDPCGGIPYASRMWHWDDLNQCISMVYDATRPAYHCQQGAFMHVIGKMSVSECDVDETTRLYVMFSRMGAHTSANGDTNADCSAVSAEDFGNFANSDIYVTGSSDGGLTWGPNPAHPLYSVAGPNSGPVQNGSAVNLTNTQTDECTPGNCMSEHWGTMSKYNVDSLHIMYVEDHHAGAGIRGTTPGDEEGVQTENTMQYAREGCFLPTGICGISATPVDVAVTISPSTGSGCTVPTTAAFSITLTNTGNQTINFTAAANQTFISPANTGGSVGVGCNGSTTLNYTAGPITVEGQYAATITVTANCGGDPIVLVIDVTVNVDCYPAEYATLSTACWSVDVWNNARVGGDGHTEGQMFWFIDQIALMFDESIIITFADDTCQSYFSMFDGSDSNAYLVSTGPLVYDGQPNHEHASATWATGDYQYDQANDPAIAGTIDYYLPTHPDTCVLIEKITVCNNADTTVRIHIGEGIDWDIPDGDNGSENQCGTDVSRQMVYQYGPAGGPEEQYYGGAAFTDAIPGAIVLSNLDWIYDNSGYQVCEIGGLLARHTGFEAVCDDSMQDRNSVYVIAQNVVLGTDECVCFIKVKTSSLTGLADLQALIDKGKAWVTTNGISCAAGGCDADIGNANGSTEAPTIDIDDVVYLIAYIFSGGPPPTPYPSASGDANCSCEEPAVDIDDVVYLIAYIFSGGPPPCTCEEWVAICGTLH